MRILCAYSGVDFQVEHFSASLTSREACHPIFYLPQRKLLGYLSKWAAGQFTPTDSYLYFLAILKSSDLVQFRVPATRSLRTESIIAHNMEPLVKTVIKLNTVLNPSVTFPQFVMSPETSNLDNVQYWIQNWNDSYEDFKEGKGKDYDDRKLAHREMALERMIKSPYKPVSAIANQLSDWAAVAGNFPTALTISRISLRQMTIGDYWKEIITACGREDKIYNINRQDLEELIEHCETEINYGTIFSSTLFKLLRSALDKQKNYLGLGDSDITKTTFQILTSTDSVEDANLRAAINSAPTEMPRPEMYPTKFAFMRAKMNYDLARKHSI